MTDLILRSAEHSAATNEMFLLHPWAMIRPEISAWKFSIIGNWKRTFLNGRVSTPSAIPVALHAYSSDSIFYPLVRRIPVEANWLTPANLWGLGFLTRDVSTTTQPATYSLNNFHRVHFELFIMCIIHFFTFNLTSVVHPYAVQPLNYSRGVSARPFTSTGICNSEH